MRKILTLTTVALLTLSATAQKKKKNSSDNSDYKINSGTVGALGFRNIGPALTAGRISDLAVNPKNHSQYYITIASGGIFKTDMQVIHSTPFLMDRHLILLVALL